MIGMFGTLEKKEDEIKSAEYEICFLFECQHCGNKAAIVDPNLIVAGLQGCSVKIKCPKCEGEHVLRPKHRIMEARNANRHERRKIKSMGLVGPNGAAL